MRQKLVVEKKIENIKIGLIGLENSLSRPTDREQFLQQINLIRTRVAELEVLISNETEEFN
jgi:hypothetical protein